MTCRKRVSSSSVEESRRAGCASLLVGRNLQAAPKLLHPSPNRRQRHRQSSQSRSFADSERTAVASWAGLLPASSSSLATVITSALRLRIDGFKNPLEDSVWNSSHQLANLCGIESWAPVFNRSAGNGLVHDGERIAHRTIAGFSQQSQRCLVSVDVFVARDRANLRKDIHKLYGMKAEVLAARAHGLRDVFRLRRRHHEDDVVRRLLERLEQGIEGSIGDLMGLVEDVDLVFVACGTVACRVA